jgi:hypothetical protein
MDIIIIMCWSIWVQRNSWIFNNDDPSATNCKITFKREFALVLHMAKNKFRNQMESWLLELS